MAVSENDHVSDGVDKANGRTEPIPKPKRSNPVRWSIGVVVRLCIWYALLTPFFRCPSHLSDLNESSPRVCKPYLMVRSHVEPRVLPYYNIYAAPYVDLARPYVLTFNEQVKQNYEKYGAPAFDQAWTYGEQQWDTQVAPRLLSAHESINGIYKSEVDPHVQRAVMVVMPYYEKASTAVTSTYGNYIVPLYTQSSPIIGKTYTSGQNVLTTTVLPYAQNSWASVIYFANSSLRPKVTGLYSENVEPQLVKIGQRLASYREGKRLRESVDEVDSTSEEAYVSHSASGETNHASSVTSSTATTTNTQTSLSPTQKEAQAREKIASDLQVWQQKFAVAAEKGTEELREQVEDIVSSHIASGAKSHGESLTTALDTVVADGLSTIQSKIKKLAESLPYEDVLEDEAKAQGELLQEIKRTAITIRERAQAIREWQRSFDEELVTRVSIAINSTLDILDNVRDLGLQEIGMRWAWMDGVTYKDWARYHSLKAQFDDWRSDISQVGLQHAKLNEAQNMSNGILSRGMEAAESTAKELARLRDVGTWKISAREASDDFSSRSDPPPALPKRNEAADTSAEDGASQSAESSPESEQHHDTANAASSTTSASPAAEDPELGVDEQIFPTGQGPPTLGDEVLGHDFEDSMSHDSIETEADTSAKPKPAWGVAAAEIVQEQVPLQDDILDDDPQERFTEQLESGVSKAGDNLAEVTRAVSEALLGPSSTPGFGEHASSLASDQYPRAFSAASNALYGTPLGPGEKVASDASEQYSQAVSAASSAIYATPTSRSPIDYIAGIASSRLTEGMSKASSQLAEVQATVTPLRAGPNHVLDDAQRRYYEALGHAHYQYYAFLSSARSAVYGKPTGQVQHLTSKASENWEDLVSKASVQVYGTQASYSRQLLNRAAPNYEAVEGLISELLVGKESDFAEKIIDKLRAIYETPYPASTLSSVSSYASDAYESVATNLPSVEGIIDSANKQLDGAISTASVQVYGNSRGPVEKATSAAGSAYAEASSQISTAVYGEEQGYFDVARSAIDEAYSSARTALSNAIYTPTPTPSPVKSAVDAAYVSVSSAVEDQQKAYESATNKLGVAVESAQAQLADLVSSASSLGSEATETVKSEAEALTDSMKGTPSLPTKDEL